MILNALHGPWIYYLVTYCGFVGQHLLFPHLQVALLQYSRWSCRPFRTFLFYQMIGEVRCAPKSLRLLCSILSTCPDVVPILRSTVTLYWQRWLSDFSRALYAVQKQSLRASGQKSDIERVNDIESINVTKVLLGLIRIIIDGAVGSEQWFEKGKVSISHLQWARRITVV